MRDACTTHQECALTGVRYHAGISGNETYLVRKAYISTYGRHSLKNKIMDVCNMKYMKYLSKEVRTIRKKLSTVIEKNHVERLNIGLNG